MNTEKRWRAPTRTLQRYRRMSAFSPSAWSAAPKIFSYPRAGPADYPICGGQSGPVVQLSVSISSWLSHSIGNCFSRSSSSRVAGCRPLRMASMMVGESRVTQDAAEVGFVDGPGLGQVTDGGIASGLQHVAPAMGANDGFDDRVVDARRGRDPGRGARGCHHLFATALVAHRDGNVHRNGAAVLAQGRVAKLT